MSADASTVRAFEGTADALCALLRPFASQRAALGPRSDTSHVPSTAVRAACRVVIGVFQNLSKRYVTFQYSLPCHRVLAINLAINMERELAATAFRIMSATCVVSAVIKGQPRNVVSVHWPWVPPHPNDSAAGRTPRRFLEQRVLRRPPRRAFRGPT